MLSHNDLSQCFFIHFLGMGLSWLFRPFRQTDLSPIMPIFGWFSPIIVTTEFVCSFFTISYRKTSISPSTMGHIQPFRVTRSKTRRSLCYTRYPTRLFKPDPAPRKNSVFEVERKIEKLRRVGNRGNLHTGWNIF